MADADMAGPLVFALILGFALLMAGKLHFGYIYGFGMVGSLAVYLLVNLMAGGLHPLHVMAYRVGARKARLRCG